MSKKLNEECKICGENGIKTRYGMTACRSCISFHCKNKNKIDWECTSSTNECAITKATRDSCRKCRIEKCRTVGMVDDDENLAPLKRNNNEKQGESEQMKRRKLTVGSEVPVILLSEVSPKPEIETHTACSAEPQPTMEVTNSNIDAVPASSSYQDAQISSDEQSVKILRPAPPSNFLSNIVQSAPQVVRSCPFQLAFYVFEENTIRANYEVLYENVGTKHLPKTELLLLITKSFILNHLLDSANMIINQRIAPIIKLNDGRNISIHHLVLFFNHSAYEAWDKLLTELSEPIVHGVQHDFSDEDYILYRQLAFFDPVLMENDENYRSAHLQILNNSKIRLQERFNNIIQRFRRFVSLAKSIREYLYEAIEEEAISYRAHQLTYNSLRILKIRDEEF